jgi:hypothetical protein
MLAFTDLSLLMRRQALCDYSAACEAAQIAAERCGATKSPAPDTLEQLRICRARVVVAEEMLEVVGEGVATQKAWIVSLPGRHHDLVVGLVGIMLDRLCGSLESSEDGILAAARDVQRLRALLDELGPPRAVPPAQDTEGGAVSPTPRR